jgi:hypothetical protein
MIHALVVVGRNIRYVVDKGVFMLDSTLSNINDII